MKKAAGPKSKPNKFQPAFEQLSFLQGRNPEWNNWTPAVGYILRGLTAEERGVTALPFFSICGRAPAL